MPFAGSDQIPSCFARSTGIIPGAGESRTGIGARGCWILPSPDLLREAAGSPSPFPSESHPAAGVFRARIWGWIISGRCQTKPTIVHSYSLTLEDAINRNVERLWKVEDVSKSADIYTPEQRKCEEKFVDSVRRDDDGRIVVRLPFKTDPSLLGNSYETARRRFQALECRLSRSADMRSKYIDFMQEFEALGHMSLVEMPRLNVPHFYIPHHCVLKPTSTSTKLRVVFDASCQTTSQKSLNDLLMVGPTIQPDLYTLLLRFRTYRYVITADVVKMFRQVLVDADDRKFQYILWRSNPVKPVRTFELNTVTYGTATAPYLAIRSMIYLADQYSNKFKENTSSCDWRHVSTHENPADLLSKGCNASELQQSIWFDGPAYLLQDQLHWPADSSGNIDPDVVQLEKRKSAFTIVTINNRLLEAVTDGFELLKVGGRLELANVPDTQRHPILLPSKDFFVHQYVQHIHLKNFHAGPKALVALIRLRFWIVNARDLACRVVRSCVHCIRYRPTLEKQVMGQLPVERLTQSKPFSRCGVDFCGPINIYARIRGKTPSKGYIAVFICFATKAVHVEVVSDLSTDAFIAALKRLIARRGLPSDIFCDNATNFVGANNKAPHFGGLWEAAVKSVKGLLNRTLANTRHFIVGDSLRSLPEPSVEDSKVDHLERWQRVSAIKQSGLLR
ncbi:uncharacterized protein [Drosophila kikkawai]|uniref:Integrase zinc-binding domain-containing protein n=1 Tax=Drosophila kikkawai TaxID=30033 RepID=A0ABM4GLM1_DROKI